MDKFIRWVFTSENWFARWLRSDFEKLRPINPRIGRKIQERINRAEFDAAVHGVDPIPEYKTIYKILTKEEK